MKIHKAILPGLIIFLVAGYLLLWLYSANWFRHEIDHAYETAGKNGFEFLGPKPVLKNFPFVPEVAYGGGFQAGNARILFKSMLLRGYPIPGFNLHIRFPEGISLDGIADPKIWTLNILNVDLAIPFSISEDFEYESLNKWKSQGGKIDIRHFEMTKDELRTEGNGFLTLDDDLQPVFNLQSTIHDYELFVQSQTRKGLIEPFAGAIGITIMNRLSTTDAKTGEKTVSMGVSVRNRMLQVGPLQVLQFPLIVWDKRNSPDPHL